MLAVAALFCGAVSAQDVVLDFTNAAKDWGIEATSSSKEKGTKEYTNGTYTITLAGDGKNGFAAYDGNILFGKQGAYITLPAFDFPVAVVQYVGRDGASASTKMNVFVGEEAICKETLGSVGTNNYFIPEAYQSGKQFTIKVTSAHNAQLTKINIYKVGNTDAPQNDEDKPLDLVGNGSAENPFTVSDIIAMHSANQDPAEKVWVKGIIAGNIDTGNGNKLKVPVSGTDAVASNLAISEGEKFASVQLVGGTDARAALNIQEHFNYIGTEVAVHGTVTAYCGMAGVKELDDYAINAPETKTLPEGFVPCPVQDFTAAWVEVEGKNNVEGSFVVPTEMISEMTYEKTELSAPITKIEVQRIDPDTYEGKVVTTFYYPALGDTLSWTEKNLPYGSYEYQAQVYVADAMDWANPTPVIVGQLPADVEPDAFTATIDPADPYKITLEVTLPTMNSLFEPLTMPITKVEFGEMGPMSFEPEVLYTEDAEEVLTPGGKLQYTIEKATDGAHMYTVQVYTAAGGTWPTIADVFVGKDQPGMVQNLTATVTPEGIVVAWEAPTVGLNGGDMGNVEDITYTVLRGANEYDANAVVIAENIKELTITDPATFEEETKFLYIVTAKSPYGDGYPATSNELVVGPAASLPFAENFDVPMDEWGNTTTEHSTWSKDYSDWFCAWQIGQSTIVNNEDVMPHNGGGLLYAYYDPWSTHNQWDAITTGHIDCSSADAPTITFWLYDVAMGGAPVTLKVQASANDGEFVDAETIAMGNATETGWRMVTVALPTLKNAQVGQVRFLSTADGSGCIAVAIDEVNIFDANGTSISSLEAIEGDAAFYNLNGQRVDKNTKGIVVVRGKKILNK